MKKKVLIITSGSSQLITQLSVLKNKAIDFNNVSLIYTGLFNESLELFFKQVSDLFGFTYLGQILFNINPIALSKKDFFYYFLTGRFSRLFNLIEKKYPLLVDNRNFDLLIIPVRVKVFSDNVLLSYLKPKSVLLVADGVIDVLPERNFKNWKYYYLKKTLTSFPLSVNIYSPHFLKIDMTKIGVFKEVNIDEILKEICKIGLVSKFKKIYMNDSISHVIISQHYHLHEGIELENDILYYTQIIKYALENCGNSKVLFKPHPRDIKQKIEKLQCYDDQRLLVVDDELKSLPIEFLGNEIKQMQTVFLTGNSSAPLYFKKTNNIISVCSKKNLHVALNNRVKEFSNKYNINYIDL